MSIFNRRHTALSRETCTLQPNPDDSMEDFRVETIKALWQAFNALDTARSELVHVSQLKVITSNVGMKMGFDKAEELLKDYTNSLDFKSYIGIVETELINKMADKEQNGMKSLSERLNSVLKSCWTFCNFERLHKSKWLSSDHCLVLWRLFNFLAETDESGEPILPVQLHREEAEMILKHFVDVTGQKNQEQVLKESLNEFKSEGLCFTDFLNLFEKDCVTNLSKGDITHGLNHLQDTYILNILGKGMMWKRGYKVKNWKERWLVMTPTSLKYFVSNNQKILKGSIEFDSECRVEVLPDRPTHKQNRFVIHTSKKPYEMSAPDMKTKNEWVSGIQMALDHLGKETHIQKEAARKRCDERRARRREQDEAERRRREEEEFMKQQQGELDEEKRKRLEDEELLRKRLAELEEEKRLREEAEARYREERMLKEMEQQRLRELEEIRRELERLLEEERQAKRDEEIVRNLQAKLLEEEFERREELERLKQQQEDMLKAEREQKALLEVDRQAQEARLRDAQARLQELETERALAAQKMQEATEKLQKAEKDRHIMEEKVKLWKTPVGLARPIQPTANPFVTHRGQGAFCEKDFISRDKLLSESNADNEQKQPTTSTKPEGNKEDDNKNDKKLDEKYFESINESQGNTEESQNRDTPCEKNGRVTPGEGENEMENESTIDKTNDTILKENQSNGDNTEVQNDTNDDVFSSQEDREISIETKQEDDCSAVGQKQAIEDEAQSPKDTTNAMTCLISNDREKEMEIETLKVNDDTIFSDDNNTNNDDVRADVPELSEGKITEAIAGETENNEEPTDISDNKVVKSDSVDS